MNEKCVLLVILNALSAGLLTLAGASLETKGGRLLFAFAIAALLAHGVLTFRRTEADKHWARELQKLQQQHEHAMNLAKERADGELKAERLRQELKRDRLELKRVEFASRMEQIDEQVPRTSS